jgi:hypothetical protein
MDRTGDFVLVRQMDRRMSPYGKLAIPKPSGMSAIGHFLPLQSKVDGAQCVARFRDSSIPGPSPNSLGLHYASGSYEASGSALSSGLFPTH